MIASPVFRLAALAAFATSFAPLATGQEVGAATAPFRWVYRPALPFVMTADSGQPDRIVLKFREGMAVRQTPAGLVRLDGGSLDDARTLLASGDVVTVQRLFTRPVLELDAERASLQANVPAGEPPLADLNNYYLVVTNGARASERLVNALNELPIVETAYPEPVFVPASLPHDAATALAAAPGPTPNLVPQQDYLEAPPDGVDFHRVHSIVGARAPDIAMCQAEGSWIWGHEDSPHMSTSNLIGQPPFGIFATRAWQDHGAACVGIMAAGTRNDFGLLGMGTACSEFYVCSLSNGAANMISLCTPQLDRGDVMSSSFAPSVIGTQYPLDFFQAEYDAVRMLTAKGVFYTIPAGNTGLDLGNVGVFGQRYLPGSVSSGAFINGATDGRSLVRVSWSNYGTRCDASGWGSDIVSLGYGRLYSGGDPNGRQDYDDAFGGTSAGAPLLAGVIATLTGVVREQNGLELSLQDVRDALRQTGTPTLPGATPIGTRPDLTQLLARWGLPDGMRITRDGTLGGTWEFEVAGNPGEPFGVLFSDGRGRVDFGFNRPLLLNAAFLIPLLTASVPAGGTLTQQVPVPNDPTFQDVDYYLQTAFVRGGTIHLSNSVEVWIY